MENKRNFAYLKVLHHSLYSIKDLGNIEYHYDFRKRETSANLIICGDTETSREAASADPVENYIVAWSICVFNYVNNRKLVYWGNKPTSIIDFITKLKKDIDGAISIYFHNLNYDYTFLRLFAFEKWGFPEYQLATKPHKPLIIEWKNAGIRFKDSLILAQRSLERWALDLNAEHKKAVGFWDYQKIRTQKEQFTSEELQYIANDVIAQAECLNILRESLNIHAACDLPITSTSIIRNEARKRSRGSVRAGRVKWYHKFKELAPPFNVYLMLERGYHGGYVHANRYAIGDMFEGVIGYDFASSYPFLILSEKMPMERFTEFPEATPESILKLKDNFAFIFDVLIYDFELKEGIEMPYLQRSKITRWTDDYIMDNGRVISGTLAQITYTEIDLELFCSLYNYRMIAIKNCYRAAKAYLPDWLRGYVFELFKEKTMQKNGDPVLYALAKSRLNGVYGMCVEKQIRTEFTEDYSTGEYFAKYPDDPEAALMNKYNSRNSFLVYQWGVWICAAAVRNLYELGRCCGVWLYSDTDSVKGLEWDKEAVNAYNEKCKNKLRAAGFPDPVIYNGREYWLGVAEYDGFYSEFIAMGSKRYVVRENGVLKITVAGVPKAGAACLHNNIFEFQEGKVFDGKTSGKKLLTYFLGDQIREKDGILYGNSIDLTECDYLLSSVEKYNGFWEVYEEVLPFDLQ